MVGGGGKEENIYRDKTGCLKFLKLEEALKIFNLIILQLKKPPLREANWPPQDHNKT